MKVVSTYEVNHCCFWSRSQNDTPNTWMAFCSFVSRKFSNTISHVDSYQYYIVSACVRCEPCSYMIALLLSDIHAPAVLMVWPLNLMVGLHSPLATLHMQLGSFCGFKCEVLVSNHYLQAIANHFRLASTL